MEKLDDFRPGDRVVNIRTGATGVIVAGFPAKIFGHTVVLTKPSPFFIPVQFDDHGERVVALWLRKHCQHNDDNSDRESLSR